MKFLCDQCKAKYQIADERVAGKTVRMKCRKCGYQIEVRAAVTESSVSRQQPRTDDRDATAGRAAALSPQPGPSAGQKPAAPRAGALATSLAAARPARGRRARAAVGSSSASHERQGGALTGAFQKSIKDEEHARALDLREISASDEWYVAINGVPVGPIRIAEVRRKAATGAVTEDSLAWQEGLEEWRPVRTFAELAAIVREAAASNRTSLLPGDGTRPSTAPPAVGTPSSPPVRAPSGAPLRNDGARNDRSAPRAPQASPQGPSLRPAPSQRPPSQLGAVASARNDGQAGAVAARSNVVPIGSRLATAERLDEAPHQAVPRRERRAQVRDDADRRRGPARAAHAVRAVGGRGGGRSLRVASSGRSPARRLRYARRGTRRARAPESAAVRARRARP